MAKALVLLLLVPVALVGSAAGRSGVTQGDRAIAGALQAALRGSVVRVGSLHGEALLGVQLRTSVCARSSAEAARILPLSVRIAHYATAGRSTARWGKPFRVLENDLYWLVSLGETGGACNRIPFEDVIPPENYGGVESPLGALGYSRTLHCYGVQLTLRATLERGDRTGSTPVVTSRRAIIQCGRFHAN